MNQPPAWQSEFPYDPQSITVDGCKYAYIDEGSGQQPIVAVHGNPTWSFYWRRLIKELSPHQRVLAVDHIGCGRSDKPQQYEYSLAKHRDNLLNWINHLDLKDITLVVHDWGGAIGLSAAIVEPKRFSRLVVTNTGAFPPPYIPRRISACRIPVLGTLAVRGFNAFAGAAIRMATFRYSKLPPTAASGLLTPYDSWQNRVAIDAFVKDIPRSVSHPTYEVLQHLEQNLDSLAELPILMIWGMRDWCFTPECLRIFQKHWPDAETIELNDVGHYVMEDAPDETITAIKRFLNIPR